ncbi:Cullin-4A [Wickerhamomyces ciferrii]|uniref:Cullin-4A n=1 Tax=Wickerhamomyces ciferrii (strain ATCC 14091 / BCRC 22168 / CBS 111 / JCM 3599 / NBRC 0793 / NRRL Y-1031 F-60-10) TaxID=1206466 RepID=K0K6X6_WICCF|nr:Cullin-4A [Wickerhamomyces ciferrii]CCH40645.1 Cullin-4A [Wickerhamomyces ciferrii]
MSASISRQTKISSRPKSISSPYLNSVYEQLNGQIDLILRDPTPTAPVTISYQRLFRYVEFLCRDKQQSKLTVNLYDKFDAFLNNIVDVLQEHGLSLDEIELLQKFVELSHVVDIKVTALEKIHLYLDRTYLLNHPTKPSFTKFAMLTYLNKIHEKNDLAEIIENAFSLTLNNFRDTGDQSLVPLLIKSFKIYHKLLESKHPEGFESFVLQSLKDYYNNTHVFLLESEKDQSVIFEMMYKLLNQEISFWEKGSDSISFKNKVKYNLTYCLIFNNFEQDAIKFIKPLFVTKKFSQIAILFKFIQNAPSTDDGEGKDMKTFSNIWYSYVYDYILSLAKTMTPDIVERLIKSKKHLAVILSTYMDNNYRVEVRLRDAFSASLHDVGKDSENLNGYILKYIDGLFKSANPKDHDHNSILLRDVHLIFKSIKAKTVFIRAYQRDLSKRLINETTKDIELEKEFIKLLEQEVGRDECDQLRTMIEDVEFNEELVDRFRRQLPSAERSAFGFFEPLVLSSKVWPPAKSKINIPDDLKSYMTKFQQFYLKRNTKKTLTWSQALSHMTVSARFKKGTKELHLGGYQGIVLLLFNDYDELTFEEIKTLTNLDSKNLSGVLHSLTNGRYKILVKAASGKYLMNENFEDRRKAIKVRNVPMKLKSGEDDEDEDLLAERETMFKSDIDEFMKAFIVRTMKSQKELTHNELVAKIHEEFSCTLADIKKNIDALIHFEFITRVDSSDLYKYIPG